MASEASKRIRAGLVKSTEPSNTSLEDQRREWEETALKATLPPGTIVEAVLAYGVHGEYVCSGEIDREKVLLFLHGGGFNTGSCKTHRELAARLSLAAGIPVLLIDYRLAPENPFPAAIEDVAKVYRWLINSGRKPAQIAIGGDSAGGGLAVSGLLYLRDHNDPMSAAAVILSGMLDLTFTGASMVSRADLDPTTTEQSLRYAAQLYIGDRDAHDPLISPIYGDLKGLPPLLIQAGDHEILMDDSVRLAERAKVAGVEVALEIWPEMWHVFQSWAATMPEAQEAIDKIGAFLRARLR